MLWVVHGVPECPDAIVALALGAGNELDDVRDDVRDDVDDGNCVDADVYHNVAYHYDDEDGHLEQLDDDVYLCATVATAAKATAAGLLSLRGGATIDVAAWRGRQSAQDAPDGATVLTDEQTGLLYAWSSDGLFRLRWR
jgi:hypothetical protein